MTHLKFKGRHLKEVLTKKALETGVTIRNRVMIFELLGGPSGATGALGIDTREGNLVEFRAKSVFLGTGSGNRMYPASVPALLHYNYSFSNTGDGRAAAYRLGAELYDMEIARPRAGIKNFCLAGQATWAGVCRDPQGRPVGKYLTKPNIQYPDIIIEVDKKVFERYAKTGKGPVYMDCTGQSEGYYKVLMEDLEHEGNRSVLAHLQEEGIDLRKDSVEFATFGLNCSGRIVISEKTDTSVVGLFAGGNETVSDISGAAVFGWIGGKRAADYSTQAGAHRADGRETIEAVKSFIDDIRQRDKGPDWKDANIALQQIMGDYAGAVRSPDAPRSRSCAPPEVKEESARHYQGKESVAI